MSGSGSITDVLSLADAINTRRATDERFGELLGEISTALAEILAAMEKGEGQKPKPLDIEAMTKAMGAALAAAIKTMPAPSVTLPAMEHTSWKALDVSFKRGDHGGFDGMRITRAL